MKTNLMALLGLGIAALFNMGCRITHYGPADGKLAPNEQAVCRATCERLIEEQAIDLDGARSCLASCGSPDRGAKKAVAKAEVERPLPAEVERPAQADQEEEERPAARAKEGDCSREVSDAPCGYRRAAEPGEGRCREEPRARPRPPTPPQPPAAPATACQGDWECPEDMICKSGVCR